MLRICCYRTRRCLRFSLRRAFSSSSSSSSSLENSVQSANNVKNPQHILPPSLPMLHHPNPGSLSPLPSSLSRNSILALSATVLSAIIAASVVVNANNTHDSQSNSKTSDNPIYAQIEHTIEQYNASIKKIINQMKHTGVAASVLWQSLRSVLSSANHEVRVGFELRVAALLADIAAANASRRAAIVGAGGGKVLDWLLETVANCGDSAATQAEAARALAYLVADPNVCVEVLGRPHAVPNILRFIFSCQPQRSMKHSRHTSFDVSDSLKGRSMLVTAIMDIVTSNCDSLEKVSMKPLLAVNAEMGDIAAAIQVIEDGSLHLDEPHDEGDGEKGIRGIGLKVLGGTTILGLSRANGLVKSGQSDTYHLDSDRYAPSALVFQQKHDGLLTKGNFSSGVVPGLWDDLHCQHVAVPFAAWALANWAMASEVNRSHIQELDQDGHAIMNILMAPERSVKWHGSLVARLLLEDRNLALNDSVSDWSSSLLSTIFQASKAEDISLIQVALSAFLISVERSHGARKVVMEEGLHLMRETAKQTATHKHVQESLAKALELLCAGEMHLSLEESQKWSGILLPWVFGKFFSESIRSSAIKILSHILEYYGPSAVPISQGWLAIMLTEILGSRKKTKASTPAKSDKVKTQIDHSNTLSAGQIANQLAGAVVNLAGNQLGTAKDSADSYLLADLLSLEPFAGPFKNLKKDSPPKFYAADSASATLKGIKALTEVCAEDPSCQDKIADFGVLCLLRRFLLQDDYEKLAAIEAYDASRDLEAQERVPNAPNDSSRGDAGDLSRFRVPPTAHIRRHAARLLTILSLRPKVQKVIVGDEIWCKWLEDCANGKIPGCNDHKIQSYARATLLNIFCNGKIDGSAENDNDPDSVTAKNNSNCPRYSDRIFLINPDLPHWKCPEEGDSNSVKWKHLSSKKPDYDNKSSPSEFDSLDSEPRYVSGNADDASLSTSEGESASCSKSEAPLVDVVFVHGLRGGPYKTWRIADEKSSSKSGLVEKIDEEAGKLGTFWPGEWLSADFPQARLFSLKYKTNLTQWSGASLPLQEVSSMLLEELVAAGIGDRPLVFVTHSMGGLVVKQLLYKAKAENIDNFVNNTIGVVFYSCPHFGSKLADMPWRMGFVFRPAPSIGELRSGSPRLVELNDFMRHLHKKGLLEVLSFSETKVTPLVEGYGGWGFRMEIVPLESAFPGYGELVALESTDHVNSCKPVNRTDPSYTETVKFLHKLKARLS